MHKSDMQILINQCYMKIIKLNIFLVIVVSFLVSCEKEEDNDQKTNELVTISETISESGSLTAEIMANDTLFEGYNKLFVKITDVNTNVLITEANLMLMPKMHMVSMMHAAPVENPASIANADNFFEGAVVFIMPSNPDEGWTLDIASNISGEQDTFKFDIPVVKNLDEPRKINIISTLDETKYFLSLVEPMNPEVGINDLEFTVHYKKSMMSFPAAEDLEIEIEPEMPSMDHGSPNNVNPIHTQNGHYKGKVNFTMTGWWRVNITLLKNGTKISEDSYMDITFQ